MTARDADRRLLEDVLLSAEHRAWKQDLRERCHEALGTSPQHALLEDIFNDDGFAAFKGALRERARPRRSRLPRWLAASLPLSAVAGLVWALVAIIPGPNSPVEPAAKPARVVAPKVWTVTTRALRPSIHVVKSPVRVVTTSAGIPSVRSQAMATKWSIGRARPRLLGVVRTPARESPRQALSDRQLLALLPPCGLIRTGPASKRLWFFDSRDERQLTRSR